MTAPHCPSTLTIPRSFWLRKAEGRQQQATYSCLQELLLDSPKHFRSRSKLPLLTQRKPPSVGTPLIRSGGTLPAPLAGLGPCPAGHGRQGAAVGSAPNMTASPPNQSRTHTWEPQHPPGVNEAGETPQLQRRGVCHLPGRACQEQNKPRAALSAGCKQGARSFQRKGQGSLANNSISIP